MDGVLGHLLGGGIGAVLSPVSKYLNARLANAAKKMDLDHEAVMADKHVAEIEAEAQASIQVAAEHAKGKLAEESYRAFGASIARDQAAGAVATVAPWVASFRALLAPFVVVVSTAVLAADLLHGGLTMDEGQRMIWSMPFGWLFGHFASGGFGATPAAAARRPQPLGWDNLLASARQARNGAAKDTVH